MQQRTRALAAVLAAVASLTAGAHAYSTFGKWYVTPVVVYINPANADVAAVAAEAALQAGMDVWNTQSGSSFRFLYGGRVNDMTTGNDGKSVVIFRNTTNGSALATTYSWSSNGSLVDSDIIFWDAGFTFFTGTAGCSRGAYIEDVAAHELGHALGLSHSSLSGATMYPTYSWCSQEWRTLSSDDIAGVRALYPAGAEPLPAAPTGLAAGTVTSSSIGLAWSDNATNESGYRIERSLDGRSFSQIAQVGANVRSYTNSGLAASTVYYYRVRAYNTGGSSPYSNTLGILTAPGATTNTAPTVTITTPVTGASYAYGTSIGFSGSAADTQDGNISSRLTWTSSIDGSIGSGASFSRTLSAGSHTITARAMDSGGLSGSKTVSVTVATSATSGPTLTARGYKLKGSARADLSWNGVSATSVDVFRNNVKVMTTPNDGAHTDPINKKGGGSYTYKVCASGTTTCSNGASVSF